MGVQDEAPKVSFTRLPEGEEGRTQTMEDMLNAKQPKGLNEPWSLESDEGKTGFFRPRIWLEGRALA